MNYIIYSVEDDKDISKIINRTLTKQGYIVSSFENGTDFIKEFNQNKPDMVLLDMMLPDYSGAELLQMIRNNPSNDDIQVIIISANGLITDKIDGLDLGADDYIAKPFDLLELVARVNARFRKYKRNNIYKVNGITLNVESHECKRDDKLISLTVKEFEILELLFKNKGKVVTRDDILTSIWGNDELETRSIDMHIKSIRKKLEDESLIETVYGLGYKVS
ncbi:MAG: response regulator transcription factor [Acholeplasmatales bacterium]|nr:response regulator transcription factor [Acholeplasmatales bacterium]